MLHARPCAVSQAGSDSRERSAARSLPAGARAGGKDAISTTALRAADCANSPRDPQRRAEAHAAGPPGRACFFPGQSAAISCHSAHPRDESSHSDQGRQCRPPDDGSLKNVSRGRPDAGIDLAELKRGQCRYLIGELQPRRLCTAESRPCQGKGGAPPIGFVRQLLSRL